MKYIFVDLSNLIFHRYFAIQSWCKISKKTFDEDSKETFDQMFERLFEADLIKIKKKIKTDWKNVFLIQDCARCDIWRNDIYPLYKKNRISTMPSNIFPMTLNTLIPNLVEKYGIRVFGYNNAEADDVIGVLVRYLRSTKKDVEIYIISNDSDYLQLLDEHTFVWNTKLQNIKDRYDEDIIKVFLKYKIIKGDKSDNIEGIETKIGDKTALRLAQNPEILLKKLNESKLVNDRYILNESLISFEKIPEHIQEGIKTLFLKL